MPLVLLVVMLGLMPGILRADPDVSNKFTLEENVNTQKSIRKVWSNLLAGYQQARNAAKSMVRQMQLTSSLANSMEENLRAWESVAKRTEAVLHADIWDENPVTLIENMEENFFQKTDGLLYYRIPNAKQSSKNFNKARRRWVDNLSQDEESGFTEADRIQMGVVKTLSLGDDQRKQPTREKMAFDIRNTSILKTGARRDQMVFLSDNADANLSALGQSLRTLEDSRAKEMVELNTQLAENEYVMGNMESTQDMDKLELYSQILLSKASKYNTAGLSSYLALQPLISLSEALERMQDP